MAWILAVSDGRPMSLNELSQFETLAQIDDLVQQTQAWVNRPIGWAPAGRAQALVKRVLSRVETLRIRLEAPLVVATFGGTGTGKSSLVNALVGEECSESGRQRPTTRRPIVIAHPRTELEALGLPLESIEVIRRDSELLRDIVLIDCPDPDTTEGETSGSNLAILRGLLPYCDVLIYTSTQQKYRSARVLEELGQGANGCRLFFVQTHADIDSDIRDDWRAQLRSGFEVPDIFFVDSRRALREQQSGQRPSGDFGRLIDALATQLAASERVGVRRANVLDLLQSAFVRCRGMLNEAWPTVDSLATVLVEQKQVLARRMADELKNQLLTSRHLWERRLLSEVTDTWGFTPFSAMLRGYAGLGGLIASFSFYRARNSVQMALIGAVQGARWLHSKHQELTADSAVAKASSFSLGDDMLREAEIVIEGHVRASELEAGRSIKASVDDLRQQAAVVERQFLGDAGRRIDDIIRTLAARNSRWYVRAWYETLFAAYAIFVLGRVAKNFFYDSFWLDRPLVGTEFYIPAVLFFVIWSLLLVTMFTHRLRRGLTGEVQKLVSEMVDLRLSQGLFPQWETACREAGEFRDELGRLLGRASTLRDEFAVVTIGGAKGAKREAVGVQ
jgi:hypothetical protein